MSWRSIDCRRVAGFGRHRRLASPLIKTSTGDRNRALRIAECEIKDVAIGGNKVDDAVKESDEQIQNPVFFPDAADDETEGTVEEQTQ